MFHSAKRWVFLAIALLTSCVAVATNATLPVFKIGVVTVDSSTGTTFVRGLEWWRDKVNSNTQGGLSTLDGIVMKVELITIRASSAAIAAQTIVDFSNGNPSFVHVLVNTFQQFNIAVNDVMNENRIEKNLIHCSGGTPGMYGFEDLGIPRWGFQFGVMVPSSDYGTGIFKHIMSFGNRLPNTRIAFFRNTGNSFADYTCQESIRIAKDLGMEVDPNEIFEYSGTSYETVMPAGVAALKESETTIVMGCTWLQDGLALQQAIVQERLDLLATIILIAPTTGAWAAAFPRDVYGHSDGDYVLAPSQWHHTQRFNDFSSVGDTQTFWAEFKAATGSDPDYLLASCTTAGIIIERGVNKVAMGNYSEASNATSNSCLGEISFDEKLRLMIRDFEEDTMYGRVRFSKFNQNVGHEAAVIQILPEKNQTSVLPESTADSSLYFPAPPWEKRLSCPPNCTSADIFRIGVISPETPEGQIRRRGLEWWARKANENGGIRTQNGKQLEVQLVFADTGMNDSAAVEKTRKFYYTIIDPVQAMVNTHFEHTHEVNLAMRQEQISKVLMHCSGGVSDWYGTQVDGLPKPLWSYQFGVSLPSSYYPEGIFNFLSKQLDNYNPADATSQAVKNFFETNQGRRFFFFRNVGNEFAKYTCGRAFEQALEAGFQVSSEDVWDFDSRNASYPTLLRAKAETLNANNYWMSVGCTWKEDGIELQKAIAAAKTELFVNVILEAPSTEEWLQAFPPDSRGYSDGDYVLSPTDWHHTQHYRDSSSVGMTEPFVNEYRSVYGGELPMPDFASCTAAGVVLEQAMRSVVWNGVQGFDDEALRIAVRDIRIDTFYGGVRFDNFNQNVGHDAAVLQVLPDAGQTLVTSVLPETNSERNIKFPAPLWEWRDGCPQSKPDASNGVSCEVLADDAIMQYIIGISIAVPLCSLCAVYFGRLSCGVLRRRREKFVKRWLDDLDAALWEQDEAAVKVAEAQLRRYRGKSMFGQSYHVPEISQVRREQSLQAGIGVAYLLSEEFYQLAAKSSGLKDPTFHDLKRAFFMGEKKIGSDQICPRDGQKGCALIDTYPKQHRQKQTHFLSWSWQYTIRQLRSGLDFWVHSSQLDPSAAFLFMCFFVNNQHRIVVAESHTGSDELDRIFEGNLKRIGKMIALLDNWKKPVYLTRIWTIFEQYVAVSNAIEVKIILPRDAEADLFMTISTGAEGINAVKESLCSVDSATADAWSPDDKEAIQTKIQHGLERGFEEINEHVRQVMISWIGDVVVGAMQRVLVGEDLVASAHNWVNSGAYISEHNEMEDLDDVQHVRSLL